MLIKLFLPVFTAVLLLILAGCSGVTAKIEQPQGASQVNSPVATAAASQQPADDTAKQPGAPDIASTAPPDSNSPVKITAAELNKNSAALMGKEVIIEGKIVQECGSGCWFNLQDSTGIIYVDLSPNNMVIPQKVGSKAKVYGKVDKRSGIMYVIGSKVEF